MIQHFLTREPLLCEKLENTNKKVSMRLAGACLRRPISIDFLVFLVRTKIQRTNTLKVEQAIIEMKFLSGKWIQVVKVRLNLLTFTAGHETTGFHVLDNMWTTSQACAVTFNSLLSLPVCRRHPIRCRCVRSLLMPIFGRNTRKIHLISYNFMGKHAFWTASFHCLVKSLSVSLLDLTEKRKKKKHEVQSNNLEGKQTKLFP